MTVAPRFDPRVRQRASAEARASFCRFGARTGPDRTFETGGLRWRFPRSASPCETVIVNTGGGMAGGDTYRLAVTLNEAAEVEATTPAAEKIYRSEGAPARIETQMTLHARSRLFWMPQETLLFGGSALERRISIDLASNAELVVVESLVFGRLAMGEARIDARLRDSWRLRREGRLVFADETRLDHAGETLDRVAVGGCARAFATMLAAAPNIEAQLTDLCSVIEKAGADVEGGASAFDGLIVVRLLSASPSRLREALIAAILALGGRKPPRLWQ